MFKKVKIDSPHGGLNQFIFFCLSLFKGLGHGVSNLHIKKKNEKVFRMSATATFLCSYVFVSLR